MDRTFTESDAPPKQARRARLFWNIVSILIVLFSASVLCVSVAIYLDPYAGFNPYPPPKLATKYPSPTAAFTEVVLESPTLAAMDTSIPDPTNTPEASITPGPSATVPPTITPFVIPTASPTPEITESPVGYPFDLQQGSPIVIANISHPELGCDWMGVAGQALDMSGAPIIGLMIRLGGQLRGGSISQDMLSLTGSALNYGRDGYYEFTLADKPIPSKGSLWIQLLNQELVPMSNRVYFDTFDACDKNLIIINFKQVW